MHSKHLTCRTRLKRLVRKTLCFSKSMALHDLVVYLNRAANYGKQNTR
jgi:insertion element IS1 protein InsB